MNSLCVSGSRLAQCLAALGSHQGNSSSSNALLLKEMCDGWESLGKTVGVASTAVKSHMMSLLQEATKISLAVSENDSVDPAQSAHMEKVC